MTAPTRRLSKPAPAHNPLYGKGVCGCVGCSAWVRTQQCQKTSEDGQRCGNWKRHPGEHTLITATIFTIAEERVRLDGPQP